MKNVFQKLASGLTKTRTSLSEKLQRLVLGKSTIDDDLLVQLEEVLLEADVGVRTTAEIVERLRRRVREEKYESTNELTRLLREEMVDILSVTADQPGGLSISTNAHPHVIMIVGVNGVGKTTTIGKLAAMLKGSGLKVVLGAADTFRAAANEQLEIWARRAGVDLVRQSQGADPASVAFDTLSSAISNGADVVVIDTAGRLHTKINLMDELKKIKRVLEKRMPGAPHEVLLVLDACTGQNGLQQAMQFREATGVTGIILTKLDGTAKGGIVFSVGTDLKVPVKYIGVGESIDDLQPFDKTAFVDALFERSGTAVST